MIPPDPQLPPLLAKGLFHASAAPGPVCVAMYRSPAAPDLQRQRQGPPGGGQRPGPLPWPRFRPLQLLLLPLLPMLLQRHLPAPCVWGLYGESRGRGGAAALQRLGSGHTWTVSPSQAFSAFFYAVDFLRTVMGLPVASLQQLGAAVVTVCNQTWSEVRPAPLFQGFVGWPLLPPGHSFVLQVEGPGPLQEPTAVRTILLARFGSGWALAGRPGARPQGAAETSLRPAPREGG